jgi:hypothetical protein
MCASAYGGGMVFIQTVWRDRLRESVTRKPRQIAPASVGPQAESDQIHAAPSRAFFIAHIPGVSRIRTPTWSRSWHSSPKDLPQLGAGQATRRLL